MEVGLFYFMMFEFLPHVYEQLVFDRLLGRGMD